MNLDFSGEKVKKEIGNMKKIEEIYKEYKIMPTLQLHQLRVAAVAKIITDNFVGDLDREGVVKACLVHDMGNIIKFDLAYFPEFVEPEGLEYWQAVKDEYISKYGPDEHKATIDISKEINIPENVMDCLNNIGFSKSTKNAESDSFENKIAAYSDMRVSPHGVISMEERIEDGNKRYKGKVGHSIGSDSFESLSNSLRMMEIQIFEKVSIKPEEITEEKVNGIIEELKNVII